MLAHTVYGDARPEVPPLVIAHGLFGSGRNWGIIAKRLSDTRQVITVDMRNHAGSPREPDHSYPALANDLGEVIDAFGGRADVLGHSMGGKAAMVLALQNPERLRSLIVADIAPVAYGHTQMHYLNAMRDLDLTGLTTRSQADKRLQASVPEFAVRAFLLQSLDLNLPGWRLNLDVLADQMPLIMGFPEVSGVFTGRTLFLLGGGSDYVLPEHRARMRALFPKSRVVRIPGAGHWLHAEKPREFEAAVRTYLDSA